MDQKVEKILNTLLKVHFSIDSKKSNDEIDSKIDEIKREIRSDSDHLFYRIITELSQKIA